MRPTEFQKKVWFNALTAVCIVVIGTILVGSIWLSGEILAYLQPVLVPLAVAGIFAYLIDPIVNWLEKKGLSRMKAIIAVFIMGAISIAGFTVLLKQPLEDQVDHLKDALKEGKYAEKTKQMFSEVGKVDGLVESLPKPLQNIIAKGEEKIIDAPEPKESGAIPSDSPVTDEVVAPKLTDALAEHLNAQKAVVVEPAEAEAIEAEKKSFNWVDLLSMDKILESLQENAPDLAHRVAEVITRGASKFFGIIGYALGFIMVPIYLFFFLKESAVIQRNWQRFVPLKASKFKDEVIEVVEKINEYLIAFFRGQVLVSLIDGALVGFVLFLFGHPYPVLIGIALAILGVLPFIGNVICMIPAVVTAYAHFSDPSSEIWIRELIGNNAWIYVVIVLAIFIVVQQINSLVTAPKIVGDLVF